MNDMALQNSSHREVRAANFTVVPWVWLVKAINKNAHYFFIFSIQISFFMLSESETHSLHCLVQILAATPKLLPQLCFLQPNLAPQSVFTEQHQRMHLGFRGPILRLIYL